LCGPAKAVSRYLSRAKISGDAACRVSTSKSYSKQAIRREIAFEAGDPAESRDPSLHSGWKTSHTAEGDGKIFAHPRATVPHNCRHNRNFSRGGNSLHQHGSVSILGVPYFCRFAPHRLECNSAWSQKETSYRVTSVLTCSLLKGRSAMVPIAGWICQMSRAYSAMVRSLEKIPTRATFRMALRAQRSACW
jgi:hypothetical protein